MLTEIGVPNKIINSKVKDLEDGEDHWCYVAMGGDAQQPTERRAHRV